MGVEIERKFLVRSDAWKRKATGVPYRQGYLNTDIERVVRVRIMGERAVLTIKGRSEGAKRAEFEYEIPRADAEELLLLCVPPLIEKTRYEVEYEGLVWEVDEFHGANAGLVVAECELEAEDQAVTLPPWVGKEVTRDPKYANVHLVSRPFRTWRE